MAAAIPWALHAIATVATAAAAHPIVTSAVIGGIRGASNGGGIGGAARGAALGGAGSAAGRFIGNQIGGWTSGGGGTSPSKMPQGGGGGGTKSPSGWSSDPNEIIVTGTPQSAGARIGGAVGGALGTLGAGSTSAATKPLGGGTPQNSAVSRIGNQLGQSAVQQALGGMAPGSSASAPPVMSSVSPFGGGGSGAGGAPPAGLSIRGGTAPDIFPWSEAA